MKWKTVFLIYIISLFLLIMAMSYQVSSKVVNEEDFVDQRVVVSRVYNWTKLLAEENRTLVRKGNFTAYFFDVKRYTWSVSFKLEKTPQHYKVKPFLLFKINKEHCKASKLNSISIMINVTFYVNDVETYWDWFDAPACGTSITSCFPTYEHRFIDHKFLHKGWNNVTAVVYAWLWAFPNITATGTSNYTIGPFKVTVMELKTVFGLQPDYLLPAVVLLLPVSVALEILTRKFRRKLKRIERIKY